MNVKLVHCYSRSFLFFTPESPHFFSSHGAKINHTRHLIFWRWLSQNLFGQLERSWMLRHTSELLNTRCIIYLRSKPSSLLDLDHANTWYDLLWYGFEWWDANAKSWTHLPFEFLHAWFQWFELFICHTQFMTKVFTWDINRIGQVG